MDAAALRQRLQARRGHYMPELLLQSQIQTFEPPAPDERVIVLTPPVHVERLVFKLQENARRDLPPTLT